MTEWKTHVEIECREVFLVGRRGQVAVDACKFHKECVLHPGRQILYAKLYFFRKINMAASC